MPDYAEPFKADYYSQTGEGTGTHVQCHACGRVIRAYERCDGYGQDTPRGYYCWHCTPNAPRPADPYAQIGETDAAQ